MVQILAPASSLEGCTAVFAAGAHGVYLGAKAWSRGAAVHALPDPAIARCIRLARESRRFVHVAVNAIPSCRDTGLLLDKCLYYASLGVDGLILNDFGLMAKLLSIDRTVPVYVSVGCAVNNVADVKFYHDLGVTGIVLQPGTAPGEIKRIKAKYAVKVEIFGEVLLEPFLFGKCWLGSYCSLKKKNSNGKECFFGSAKRGVCSKGCKARWGLFRGEASLAADFELPFKPLSLLESIKAYAEAGVDIIKIQGRELAPEVVADIVQQYKKILP